MNKWILLALASASVGNAVAASQESDAGRDVTKFCYYQGVQYTKGSLIKDQTNRELVCIPDPDNPFGTPEHEKRLMWELKSKVDGAPVVRR